MIYEVWTRHKEELHILSTIVVIAVLVNMGGKKADTTTASSGGGTNASAAPAVLSKEGVSSDVKIVVDSFETKDQAGDNEFTKVKAQGVFKVLTVTIERVTVAPLAIWLVEFFLFHFIDLPKVA